MRTAGAGFRAFMVFFVLYYGFSTVKCSNQLQPGEIAWLYFCRWRTEKTFDAFERNLEEDKAWATGNTAQLQPSCFMVAIF